MLRHLRGAAGLCLVGQQINAAPMLQPSRSMLQRCGFRCQLTGMSLLGAVVLIREARVTIDSCCRFTETGGAYSIASHTGTEDRRVQNSSSTLLCIHHNMSLTHYVLQTLHQLSNTVIPLPDWIHVQTALGRLPHRQQAEVHRLRVCFNRVCFNPMKG